MTVQVGYGICVVLPASNLHIDSPCKKPTVRKKIKLMLLNHNDHGHLSNGFSSNMIKVYLLMN